MAIPRNFDYKNFDLIRQKGDQLRKRNRIILAMVFFSFLFLALLLSLFFSSGRSRTEQVAINDNSGEKTPAQEVKSEEDRKKAEEEQEKKREKEKRDKIVAEIIKKAASSRSKGEGYLEKGLIEEANGFFNESLEKYLELKKYSEEDLKNLGLPKEELFYNLATLFFYMNKIEKAKEIILTIVDEVNDKRYFISAGCILIKSKEFDSALNYFKKAEAADPKDGKTNYYMGIIYSEKKEYNKAIFQFSEAVKKGRNDANLYSNMGLLYNLTANYEESEKCYLKALELDSGNWQYYDILGILNFQMGKPDKSRDYYLKALELSKNIPEIYYNLGTLEFETENYPLAREYFQKLLNLFPDFYLSKDVKTKINKIDELIKQSAVEDKNSHD